MLIHPPGHSLPRLVVEGVSSGCGKTTVALGLMAALRRRGLNVQAAKVGPDYLDPQHHARVTGRPSLNLDTWLCPPDRVRELMAGAPAAEIAVIEGVMGLYDGHGSRDAEGSTADAARALGAPVVLVLDAGGMARTAGAVVLGMKRFDPDLCLAGVILNRVSGPSHADYLRPSIEETAGAPVLGWLPATPDVAIPSRHLGLLSAGEVGGDAYESLAHLAEGGLDLDRLLLIARAAPPLDAAGWPAPPTVSGANGGGSPVRIAVARDEAFQFYYAENLRLLQALGAEICFFSPLADDPLPPDVGLVYLGGGYPELHAERLAGCSTTQQGLRQFASSGGPVYAECGGLQYLGRRLMTLEGTAYPMVGLLPLTTTMERRIVALGYSEVVATGQHPFLPAGARIRVHEFHYSSLQLEEPVPAAYRLEKQGRKPRPDGFVRGKVLASYAHAHFGGAPELAEGLIHAARLYKPGCARGQHPTPYDGKE